MELSLKQKVIISVIALTAAYGTGRWASPTKVVTETKTVEVEKKVTDTKSDLDLNKHRETVTQTTRKPDGTVETTTKVTEDTNANRKTDSKSTDQVAESTESTKTVTYDSPKVTVAALGGMTFNGIPSPVWGVSVSKPVIGPITIGFFGLSDRAFGASLGLTF